MAFILHLQRVHPMCLWLMFVCVKMCNRFQCYRYWSLQNVVADWNTSRFTNSSCCQYVPSLAIFSIFCFWNFLEFAGRCLNAFTSHHSCSSPWPPSAVLSFPTSSPSDDSGSPIPTLQVQRGVTEHSLAWTALPGQSSPRPECSNPVSYTHLTLPTMAVV